MNKLIISNGSFTSLIASSIIQPQNNGKNYFLGYFKKIDSKNIQEQFNFANIGIQYEKNLLFANYYQNGKMDARKLINDLTTKEIESIYLPINSTTTRWIKIFKEIFPKALFHLYEEGLLSYIKPIYDYSLKRAMASTINYYIFHNNQMETMLKDNCPNVVFHKIPKETIKAQIKNYNHTLNISFPYLDNKKYAIILPQYYAEKSKTKTKEITSEYITICKYLIENNYFILLKDHPKSKNSIFPILLETFGKENIKLLNNIYNYPIEIFAKQIGASIIFSVYSTSLFTIKYLFDIETFTSQKLLKQRISPLSIYPTISCIITGNLIPDVFSKQTIKPKATNSQNILKSNNNFLNFYMYLIKKFSF